jgi:hypothetical protein
MKNASSIKIASWARSFFQLRVPNHEVEGSVERLPIPLSACLSFESERVESYVVALARQKMKIFLAYYLLIILDENLEQFKASLRSV